MEKPSMLIYDFTSDVYEELEDYKSKNEKAIEYIKSYNLPENLSPFGEAPISMRELKELLNILQGSDK